ncbi:RDD family protein [Jongsikchunia kroppenstedtii]|uniref:RDD family protein n=1 Tax=Jongsikchunia kroppenstedtii TaxID=1121721 RepID=UPI0003654DCE|nr:RDD family protein [Jongsikchunia kroppenstedtii]
MAEITTGEAVSLDLSIARIPSRAAAMLIDLVLQVILGALLLGIAATIWASGDNDEAWMAAIGIAVAVITLVGYPAFWEATIGRTPGKTALGLRVVRADGGPIDFRHAITRALTGLIVDFWILGAFGAVAILTSFCSRDGRRVGDVLAGTLVIRERNLPVSLRPVAAPFFAGWTARIAVDDIPDDLALAVRQYLIRIPNLTPEAQNWLGAELLEAVCRRLRTTPPPGHPPAPILAAMMAERHGRDLTAASANLVRV